MERRRDADGRKTPANASLISSVAAADADASATTVLSLRREREKEDRREREACNGISSHPSFRAASSAAAAGFRSESAITGRQ